jgi:hypothetical protein
MRTVDKTITNIFYKDDLAKSTTIVTVKKGWFGTIKKTLTITNTVLNESSLPEEKEAKIGFTKKRSK